MKKKSKDLFSAHAASYARFRPLYPPELFQYLASLAPARDRAWDCATGSGQAALILADHFLHVIASDISHKQIKNAPWHDRISYIVADERTPIDAESIDLITVAQAFHWLDQAAFINEVRRVGKKNAVIAIWCYGLLEINPALDQVIRHLYSDILGPFWDPERKMVEEAYQSVHLPWRVILAPSFTMKISWTFEHLLGYLATWSSYQKYVASVKEDPINLLLNPLKKAWGPALTHDCVFPLTLKLWRL